MADLISGLATTLGYVWVVLKVLIGLGLVIFVHELGHFIVAKACGVKCEKFYLGFDVPLRIGPIRLPRTLGKIQWGETEYGVGIIPLGGYVKMLGQDDNPANAEKEAERIRIGKTSTATGVAPNDSAVATENGDGDGQYELDPRSFPAKSVPQRMAIISAGVIMNLIFAVIFAAIAYRMGVKLMPCEIGGTSPGAPAWVENIPVGARIVQLGKSGAESDYLRFDWDLRQYVAHAGMGDQPKAIDLKLKTPDGKQEWVDIVPDTRLVKQELASFATIGIRPTDSTTISSTLPVYPDMSAGQATPAFEGGDRIVGVGGQPIGTERANEQGELPADALEAALATQLDQPLTVQVQRTEKSSADQSSMRTLDITIPPNPLKRVGLELQMGPLQGVREGSPAAAAGFQVGDVIVEVQGESVGDPLILPQRMRQWIGQPVKIVVDRLVGEQSTRTELTVQPEARFQFNPSMGPGSLVAIETIGVAMAVENTVIGIEPGSAAAEAGLSPGDVLQSAKFVPTTDEATQVAKKLFGSSLKEEIKFSEKMLNWPYVASLLQLMPKDVEMELAFTRAGQNMSASLRAKSSDRWFSADRGIRTTPLERVYTVTAWSSAWRLGFRETKEQLLRVVDVLGKLVTLQLSPKNLGGPLMIAAVAGSEASQGIPRLLLFLTFLSANLAILNFLPIPALDGGHMVFLTAEAVTGKPVDERLQGTLTLIGVVCLLGLMIFVFANDIGRLFL